MAVEEAELEAGTKFGGLKPAYRWALIIAIVGIIPGYFLAKTLSHGYWLNRYKNLVITAKPAFTNPTAPVIEQVLVNKLDTNTYSIVAIVRNDNFDLSLNQQNYAFTLYDNSGDIVTPDNQAQLNGKMFLLPSQKKYLIIPKVSSGSTISKASLEFVGAINWQKKLNIPEVNLVASQPATYNQITPPAFVTQGDILNDSPYYLNQVTMNLVLKDATGQILGGSVRTEFSLQPHERRSYKLLWANIPSQNVATVDTQGETNVLDPANLTLPSGSSGSDLNRPGNQPF